jgi:hypothetical protein
MAKLTAELEKAVKSVGTDCADVIYLRRHLAQSAVHRELCSFMNQ